LLRDRGAGFLLGYAKIVEGLQPEPEFGRGSEVSGQPQGGIRSDAAFAADDLI
jgi:hypothetical protein